MIVFVALGVTYHEGQTLLGVFTSREAAHTAYEQSETKFDDLVIAERMLDAPVDILW